MGLRPPLRRTIVVDPGFSAEQRRAIGEEILLFIKTRSKRGKAVGGGPLLGPDNDGRYSKNYVETREFKAAGKSKGKVNLTLTGDMLNGMDVISTSAGQIVIGFPDSDVNDKAVFMQEKGYNFFGISEAEKQTILSKFKLNKIPSIDQNIVKTFLRGIIGS